MRYLVLVLPMLFAGYAGAAEPQSAAEPEASEQATPAAGVTEETQATPAVGEQPAQSAAAVGDAAPAEPASQSKSRSRNTPPKGFHLVTKNGQPFYCSGEPALGSRLKSRVTCMSPEQYERAQTETKEKLRERQNQGLLKGG